MVCRTLGRLLQILDSLGLRLDFRDDGWIIAARQMELGAVGVCCQKVSEAEVMVEGGIGAARVANRLSPHSRDIVCIATSFAPSLRRRLGDGKRAIFKTACASPGALT